ncbi:hypothetical protein Syun_004012 [Stephania yunnanensis]|uniref:Uncharacterized protein n=1 Tax=Stephania yunnanensis TaxID=152371 RepID=A0AAP0L4T2_9MAGN
MRKNAEKREQSYKLLSGKKEAKDGADEDEHDMDGDKDVHDHDILHFNFIWMRQSIDYDSYHETISPSHNDKEMDVQISKQIVEQINKQMEETQEGTTNRFGDQDVEDRVTRLSRVIGISQLSCAAYGLWESGLLASIAWAT